MTLPPAATAAPRPLVLVVEDDPPIRRFLHTALGAHGFRTCEAATGQEGIALAATQSPDIVLLDLGLPDMSGLDVVQRIREWSQVPVLVLSARGQEDDKVRALDAGADDYVTKPFATGELLARLRVALRHRARSQSQDVPGVMRFGGVELDLTRRRVTRDGHEVHLTPIEFRLASELARHAGRVLTHEHLLRAVWGPAHTRQHHYLRVYVAQLRQKLESDPARPAWLQTEPGVGYRCAAPDDDPVA